MLFKVAMEHTCGNLNYFCKADDCSLEFLNGEGRLTSYIAKGVGSKM